MRPTLGFVMGPDQQRAGSIQEAADLTGAAMSYAHRCAALFVASGCALGALLGWLSTVLPRGRRGAQ